MTRADWARLALWKSRVTARLFLDAAGGHARAEAAGRHWAAAWRARSGSRDLPLRDWLERPGAGEFWIPTRTTVEWARATCTPADLALARATAAGEFDLLGSGPIELGTPPAWRRDLYSGAEWPLAESHRLPIQRGDGSDIRTVWELSRGYHFIALARAYWSTGDPAFLGTFVQHVESWITDNPMGRGPHWASPMDAGLRAANWTLALLLLHRAEEHLGGEFLERILANLYSTGLFLERHLEWHPVFRGNHFVSNGVGLVYLGTLFRGSRDGDRWMATGSRILTGEILRQVDDDGVSFEASLAYHRLVTEFFAYGGELVRRNLPGAWSAACEERLRRMYGFIAAYLPASGEAPMLGDADDGRLHAVSAEGFREPRRHALGLPGGRWPEATPGASAFPRGGFFVLRHGDDHAIIRCGAVGLEGAGSHDHNDQLSFELVLGGRRIVADSGTYAYTRDLGARFAFRSTAAHSVVQLGNEEQNPISPDRPWRVLGDRTRSECTRWEIGEDRQLFEGRHRGYEHRATGALCHRRVTAHTAARRWEVLDRVEGRGTERVCWRVHFADAEVECLSASADMHEFLLSGTPAVRLRLEHPEAMEVAVRSSGISDRYGSRTERACLVAEGDVRLPFSIALSFEVDCSVAPGC